ncbi:hypothetical protein DFH09DRAFT_1139167 [Mycena vulgaris]|nr:hypothetical protein DFH09DRAFT_1139167 [Mycena vulgaris]
MPKARTKWTKKKTIKGVQLALGREKNAPTEAEWNVMPLYNTFQVSDEDDKNYDFSTNHVVRVLPNGRKVGDAIDTHEYWVCKILEIRAKSELDVWVKVQWFYSARDAARVVPKFDASHCGQYERLQSNHIDYVSSSVFDGMATVKEYDETSLDQDPIVDDDFFYRYIIDIVEKSISPAPSSTCICTSPYNPSDASPDSLMHFCLQPACRKYYHSRCIADKGASPAAERDRGFLLSDPATGIPLDFDSAMSSASDPPKKRRRASHAPTGPAAQALLDALPPTLVHAAAQPIVKGGAFRAGGVVGNVTAVLTARRFVFEALRDGTASADGWEAHMPDRWEELVDVQLGGAVQKPKRGRTLYFGGRSSKGKEKGKAKAVNAEVLALQCPGCGGPI